MDSLFYEPIFKLKCLELAKCGIDLRHKIFSYIKPRTKLTKEFGILDHLQLFKIIQLNIQDKSSSLFSISKLRDQIIKGIEDINNYINEYHRMINENLSEFYRILDCENDKLEETEDCFSSTEESISSTIKSVQNTFKTLLHTLSTGYSKRLVDAEGIKEEFSKNLFKEGSFLLPDPILGEIDLKVVNDLTAGYENYSTAYYLNRCNEIVKRYNDQTSVGNSEDDQASSEDTSNLQN